MANDRQAPEPTPKCGEPHPLFQNGTLILKCDLPRGHLPAQSHEVKMGWIDGRPGWDPVNKPGYR